MAELEQSRHESTYHLCDELAALNAAGDLVDVLPYLGRALGLQGLACLAGSSRQFRQACIDLAEQTAYVLLLEALPPVKPSNTLAAVAKAAAAVPAPSAADQRLQPVLWLVHVAPSVAASALAAADVLQRLMHLPHVPLQHAQQLVAAGVRMPYTQLLSAARSMVAGVELWVQSQQQLGVASDIPAAAVAICCGEGLVSTHASERTTVWNQLLLPQVVPTT
jgi:hypothetical protein